MHNEDVGALGLVFIEAEKQRRMRVASSIKTGTLEVYAGQTSIGLRVNGGHPLLSVRLNVLSWSRSRSDDSLQISYCVSETKGVRFGNSKARPHDWTMQENFRNNAKSVTSIPRFGKTVGTYTLDGNRLTINVPAQRRPLMQRRLKSEKLVQEAITQVSLSVVAERPPLPNRDDFALAIRTVNLFKERMGELLMLKVSEDGTLRASLAEEFS